MRSLKAYWVALALCFAPLLLYPMVAASGWRSSSDVHALLEFASSMVATTAGVMVLLHFMTTGRWFYLFISIGFVQIGAEELVHAVFSFERLWGELTPTLRWAISSTWLAGRTMLLGAFIAAYALRGRIQPSGGRAAMALRCNLVAFAISAGIALVIFRSSSLPSFVSIGSTSKQMLELGVGLSYFLVLCLYARMFARIEAAGPLLFSILMCMSFQVLIHVFVFDAKFFYDAHWDMAHVVKLLSYFFPIFGVWGETIKVHRASEDNLVNLEHEMEHRERSEAQLDLYRGHLEGLVNQRTAELQKTLDDLKRAQGQLVQSEKLAALGSLVAGVAHELNTPIGNCVTVASSLQGASEEFAHKLRAGSPVRRSDLDAYVVSTKEAAQLLARGLERAAELVNRFKQVAVDQTGSHRRGFDLKEVVEGIVVLMRPEVKRSPATLVVEIPPRIKMDSFPGAIDQLISNLINNAIAHAFEGRRQGLITIRAEQQQDGVTLVFSDNGVGMEAHVRARIFEPFFTTRLGQGGSGLGMSICYNLVVGALGGTIEVLSDPGAGCTVVMWLPLKAPHLAHEAEALQKALAPHQIPA